MDGKVESVEEERRQVDDEGRIDGKKVICVWGGLIKRCCESAGCVQRCF